MIISIMAAFQSVLFDMDGTLTDLEKRWFQPFSRAYLRLKPGYDMEKGEKEFAKHAEKLIKAAAGRTRFLNLKMIWLVTRAMKLSFIETIRLLRYIKQDPLAFKEIEPLPHAEEIVKNLHEKGYKLAIVTTASNRTIETARQKVTFFTLFDSIITRDVVKQAKPDPSGIFMACQQMDADVKASVMVGDLPQDIEAGKAAGTYTIGVLGRNGEFTKPLLEEVEPDMIIEDLSMLLQVIESQG